LQQPKWPDPRGSPAILHVAHHLAFQPHRVCDRGKHHDQNDHRLDHRHEYEYAKWQSRGPFLNAAIVNANIEWLKRESIRRNLGRLDFVTLDYGF
jgi:hypothetical protein